MFGSCKECGYWHCDSASISEFEAEFSSEDDYCCLCRIVIRRVRNRTKKYRLIWTLKGIREVESDLTMMSGPQTFDKIEEELVRLKPFYAAGPEDKWDWQLEEV